MIETNRIKLLCGVLCGLFSAAAGAETWYWEPYFSARTGYDDNVRLAASNPEGMFHVHFAADARFGFRTEVSDVKFQTVLKTHQYDGAKDLDYNEALFGVDANLRRDLDTFALEASLLKDASRTSELETTGFVHTSIPRISAYISPDWSRQLSERSLFQLGYAYSEVDYGNTTGTSLTDYRYDSANIDLLYKLSETSDLQARLVGSHYSAAEYYSKSDSIGFQVGFSRRFSETLSTSVALGLSYSNSFFIDPITLKRDEADDIGPLISISLEKVWERTGLTGSLTTAELPGGAGRMLRRNRVLLELRHKLSERLNFALDSTYLRNESAGGVSNTGDTRNYFSIESRLNWRASRWCIISGGYRYHTQEYTEAGIGSADSNALYLNVQYFWQTPSDSY